MTAHTCIQYKNFALMFMTKPATTATEVFKKYDFHLDIFTKAGYSSLTVIDTGLTVSANIKGIFLLLRHTLYDKDVHNDNKMVLLIQHSFCKI